MRLGQLFAVFSVLVLASGVNLACSRAVGLFDPSGHPSSFTCTAGTSGPSLTAVNGAIIHGQAVVLSGAGFGTRPQASPIYWDDFESYTLNAAPTAGGWIVRSGTPVVSSAQVYSGDKAVRFSNTVRDLFQQMSRDMGVTFNHTVYFRGKLYLDDTGNACNTYQWKNVRFSSSPGAYFYNEQTIAPTKTSILLMDTWWDATAVKWFNSGSPTIFYAAGSNGIPGGVPHWGGIGAPADLFPFHQWFDYEMRIEQSSSPGAADASLSISTNYQQKTAASGLTTYGPDDGIYRYMLMGGSIVSCKDSGGTAINPNFRIYYDDLYVDNTQARVELCDSNIWSTRTHCEVQPTTAWSDSSITASVNLGKFQAGSGENNYLYVVDSNGNVSSACAVQAYTAR